MRILKAIPGVLLVLMVTSVIPSLAFAAENSSASDHGGFFEGDFATVKAKALNFLSNEIARLQGISANVSTANNMTELQAALGRDRMAPGPHAMKCDGSGFAFAMSDGAVGDGFRLSEIENVNDTTFPTVKANMVNSLQNVTVMLQNQEIKATANNNTERATQIADKITVVQNLTNQINQTTDAAGLQDISLTFMKGQFDDAINKQIAQLQDKENNTNDVNVTANINTRIADLKTLETNINNAASLSELKQVLSSSHIMVALNDHPVRKCGFRGHGRFGGMRN